MTREPVVDEVPELAASVRFEPTDDTGVLVSVGGVPVSRASTTVAQLLRAMDGTTAVGRLRERFAPDRSADEFAALLDRFRAAGLLRGAERRPPGRLAYRPPLTLQLATLRAPALFSRLDAVLRPLARRIPLRSVVVLAAAGWCALLAQAADAWTAMTTPLPLLDLLVVSAALLGATLLHEVAHGLALTRRGPLPRRAGIMLLYLAPAFFVDVTSAWRLPGRRGRVAVALAGPAVHAVVVAACGLMAAIVVDPGARRTLLVLACACAGVVALNLVPFVRFDGYIALMSALDEPDLRSRAIQDAAAAVRRRLFGGPRAPRRLHRRWSVPFGLASVVVPAVLVLWGLARAVSGLSGAGVGGALLVLGIEAVVGVVLAVAAVGGLARVARSGVGRVRFFGVVLTLVALLAVLASVITVPVSRDVGFVRADDTVRLVDAAPPGVDPALPAGRPVTLTTRGLVADAALVAGVTRSTVARTVDVPVSALAPVDVPGATIPVTVVGEVAVDVADLPAAGRAHVELDRRPLWRAAWDAGVAGPASVLFPGAPPVATPSLPSETKEG